MGSFFLGSVKRPYVQLSSPESSRLHACKQQTEGLKVGCGKTKGSIKTKSLGWVVCEVWADRWVCEVWADRWGEGEGKGGV